MTTTNKIIKETITPSPKEDVVLLARSYQTELMEKAKTENLIVCLPTGSGKTYIAIMLIKEMSKSIRASLKDGGKRTIFLVKTVTLVGQQSDFIRTHTDLSVGIYYGELGVDLWNKDKWEVEFENHQVLVFTAQVFLNLIDHNYFSLNQVNLIIFDECHHASGDNQYAALMNKHYDNCSEPPRVPPRVLGLTASLSAKKIKPKDLLEVAKELEKTYRARIGSGSSRAESTQHGTSAHVETIQCRSYRQEILSKNESLTIPFDILRYMVNKIQDHLSKKKDEYNKIEKDLSGVMLTTDYHGDNLAVYTTQSSDYTTFTQSQSITLPNLKRYLENLLEVGYELGLWGLYLFAKELRRKLKLNTYLLLITDKSAREIFDDIFQRLECLVDDIIKNLYQLNKENDKVLFSPKVFALLGRILRQNNAENKLGQCIVFVERVYTATILNQVLSDLAKSLEPPWNTRLKIKYVTGIKAIFSDKPMTAKYQRETIREFRSAQVNVLIATAVVEEGLDIPQCDLVIRFNKPQNFSSYMQSKGRARAKQNASYVLFMDESNIDVCHRDRGEYSNYEEIEKMIQIGFTLDQNDDNLNDDLSQIPPYRPSDGVVIDATRAAQLIMEYCVLLGNGQIFPPRFLFHGCSSPYTCILSMPANCPVRDDIKRTNKRKKLAKYECCLEMVKLLYQRGEFNEHCLPNRNRTILKIDVPLENRIFRLVDNLFEKKSDSSFETFSRQIATFPLINNKLSTNWHLYQINNELGFVVPCELMELPRFNLYGHNDVSTIKVVYLKSIDYQYYGNELENFCRYIFEYVFDDMNTKSILNFDIEHSTFKLLPCLLTKAGDIDCNRMITICNRKDKSLENYSELNSYELYCPHHLPARSFYMNISDHSLLKQASDQFENKEHTYADYFEAKVANLRIRRDRFLATMKGVKKPRINYLKDTPADKKEEANDASKEPVYYPIELLRYAPLNQADIQLIYKLPSILIRISQLYRIERLRKLFTDNIKCYSLINGDQMPIVTFDDCLKTTPTSTLLPLLSLTYNNSLPNNSRFQPSPGILFQSITRRSSDEKMDMENLEILGDCFLKLTVSMSLYHRYPLAGAGALTVEKGKQISNGNLYRIALQKKLRTYLNSLRIVFRGEDANWVPPGYIINGINQTEINGELGLKGYVNQKVKRKAVADMMEAFMGAFLVSTNYTITIQFMNWLGLDVIPLDEKDQIIEIPSILCPNIDHEQADRIVNNFYNEQSFFSIEKLIDYDFKDKAYLIATFTHPSSFANRLTNCYERLEFLGDAVLDFLVTRHIFVNNKDINPGRVTDIRQDLSNNGRLAYILVAKGLHTKILHNSPDLFGKISLYAGAEELFPKDPSIDILSKDIDQWADSTAPKALADVFEALVGAIFLDSGKSLEIVWKVIEPLLRQYLDRSITDPNLNPVRWFFEKGGKVVQEFSQVDRQTEKTTSICFIEAPNGNQFIGRGANKKMAKYNACRKAIQLKLGVIDMEIN